jgi:methanogenic corrinoid protein MtbC1
MWAIGLPDAAFWGFLAFVFRYIPYLGTTLAAVLPALVAFAVFPGWAKVFEVFGLFILLDQLALQLVEPFLIGKGIDVAPIALLLSAVYWSWLWGPAGLLIAVPMTVCLKVAGDHVPQLGFFSILLGSETTIEEYNEYYRMLLELDVPRARELVTNYCDQKGLEATFDDVLIPAVILAGEERSAGHISQENEQFLIDTTLELVEEIGRRFAKRPAGPTRKVFGICAPGEVHTLGLLTLLQIVRKEGAAVELISDDSSDEPRAFVKRYAPDILCLSCTVSECMPDATEFVRAIKTDAPALPIIAGGAAAVANSSELLAAGCDRICASRTQGKLAVRYFLSSSTQQRDKNFEANRGPKLA